MPSELPYLAFILSSSSSLPHLLASLPLPPSLLPPSPSYTAQVAEGERRVTLSCANQPLATAYHQDCLCRKQGELFVLGPSLRLLATALHWRQVGLLRYWQSMRGPQRMCQVAHLVPSDIEPSQRFAPCMSALAACPAPGSQLWSLDCLNYHL